MHASSTKAGSAARRGVSERVATLGRQESFGSFTAEDCDVFQSELDNC